MLFSEPKIPQYVLNARRRRVPHRFSALQRAENSSMYKVAPLTRYLYDVSVLFSEPKIPQSVTPPPSGDDVSCFSALQRAENSSMLLIHAIRRDNTSFSALQRAENSSIAQLRRTDVVPIGFSALQRAENSSIRFQKRAARSTSAFQCSSASRKFLNLRRAIASVTASMFQCSSASRKFLNHLIVDHQRARGNRFSALQRAENSSIVRHPSRNQVVVRFSALQRAENSSILNESAINDTLLSCFSALQRAENSSMVRACSAALFVCSRFQCSSASRKFLNVVAPDPSRHWPPFQCSSASRKFLNSSTYNRTTGRPEFQCSSASRKFLNTSIFNPFVGVLACFSALQRAENSSISSGPAGARGTNQGFSALQRAENSSIRLRGSRRSVLPRFQCSSASRKFLNPLAAMMARNAVAFQCSSASRKFLNRDIIERAGLAVPVSVLFSEPKIPQYNDVSRFVWLEFEGFSALQRAENSSIPAFQFLPHPPQRRFSALQRAENSSISTTQIECGCRSKFQCSSASRKFLNDGRNNFSCTW